MKQSCLSIFLFALLVPNIGYTSDSTYNGSKVYSNGNSYHISVDIQNLEYCVFIGGQKGCSALTVTAESSSSVQFYTSPYFNPTCKHSFTGSYSNNSISGSFSNPNCADSATGTWSVKGVLIKPEVTQFTHKINTNLDTTFTCVDNAEQYKSVTHEYKFFNKNGGLIKKVTEATSLLEHLSTVTFNNDDVAQASCKVTATTNEGTQVESDTFLIDVNSSPVTKPEITSFKYHVKDNLDATFTCVDNSKYEPVTHEYKFFNESGGLIKKVIGATGLLGHSSTVTFNDDEIAQASCKVTATTKGGTQVESDAFLIDVNSPSFTKPEITSFKYHVKANLDTTFTCVDNAEQYKSVTHEYKFFNKNGGLIKKVTEATSLLEHLSTVTFNNDDVAQASCKVTATTNEGTQVESDAFLIDVNSSSFTKPEITNFKYHVKDNLDATFTCVDNSKYEPVTHVYGFFNASGELIKKVTGATSLLGHSSTVTFNDDAVTRAACKVKTTTKGGTQLESESYFIRVLSKPLVTSFIYKPKGDGIHNLIICKGKAGGYDKKEYELEFSTKENGVEKKDVRVFQPNSSGNISKKIKGNRDLSVSCKVIGKIGGVKKAESHWYVTSVSLNT